ncbi:MAG: hypothetical protein R3E32_22185 [Chitinophagales bacterium]
MIIYFNCKYVFQVIDFSATHGQLLLRSLKTRERGYNIDIILKGVSHIILPTEFRGIEISILTNEEKIKFLQNEFDFNIDYDNRIFLIKDTQKKEYFINTFCFGLYHNELDILETSIGRYDFENFGELQQWYAD